MPAFENELKKEITTYSKEEIRKLLNFAKESESHIYIFLLLELYTGLRRGELFGLTWDDVDFVNKTVTVNKNRTGTNKQVTMQVLTPKTESSNRTIPITDETITALKAEKEKQQEYKTMFGNCYDDTHDFVIRNINGKPYTNLSAINRVVTRLMKKAGLKHCTIHGLRHSVATILDDNDVSIQNISKLLGHSDTRITENTYIHRNNIVKRESICVLEKALNDVR